MRPKGKFRMKILPIFVLILGIISGIVFFVYIRAQADLPTIEEIRNFAPPASTKILDCHGEIVAEFYYQRRTPVLLSDVPRYLKDALIVVEDKRFYSHRGIDFIRIFGALFYNIRSFRLRAQGASTITQQLARTMFLSYEKSLSRKFREILLALELEKNYTKDEILELYLNLVYFGNGFYGVEAASRGYFNKSVKELTLAQCALLAALPKAPNFYSPYSNPDAALKRRNLFLKMLYKHRRITKEELDNALKEPLGVVPKKGPRNLAPYFVEEIRRYLVNKYGEDFVYSSGATVHSTLDLTIQKVANQVVDSIINQIEVNYQLPHRKEQFDILVKRDSTLKPSYLQGALVAIDPNTGFIKAMVGGRDFTHSQFNRVTQAKRQAGSAFKPFVYAVALENGFTPASLGEDLPISISIPGVGVYAPENFDRTYLGNITLRRALALSRNVVAVRLITDVSPEAVVQCAHSLGIKSPLKPYYSLALGSSEVSLLEMTQAFCGFANGGAKVTPIYFTKIVDANGKILEEHRPTVEGVLDKKISYLLTNMLKSVINEGTGAIIRRLGFYYPAAGKTGTTDDFTDAWFIGYTPDLTCGVWVGYDEKKTIFHNATGGAIAAPIWAAFMNGIAQHLSGADFPEPEGIVHLEICTFTGKLKNPHCPKTRDEVFITGTEPHEVCSFHRPGIFSPPSDEERYFGDF
ncbi:MAG: PBP1A family penicillin-binding protein [candidate division WOR-3 bacterium]|nr:PBP1A family penicillin-binding protein [candidate division WOR-3 bacterium]MCX7757157.1 PBP1A family penicillin-binding protein [candidate division WOR-3 bacterium]MDW7988046.1 PBP1A family penicillin-binding protein [candidate division WOR-3 bacterium]